MNQKEIDLLNELLTLKGIDTTQKEFKHTAENMWKVMSEYTKGYKVNIAEFFDKKIESDYTGNITLSPIPFSALCVHHMLPFFGEIHFSYAPGNYILGIGRIIDIIQILCKKPTLQENLTQEIGECFIKHLNPKSLNIIINARHSCLFYKEFEKKEIVLTTGFSA